MKLKKFLALLMLSILVACSPNYNEDVITKADMIVNVEALISKINQYNIKEVSYYSEEIIVLNGVVINPITKTFGKSPDGGFMMTYSQKAAENKIENWSQVLSVTQPNVKLSQENLNEILVDMAEIGVTDVFNDTQYNTVRIQWGNSVMLGINGLVFGENMNVEAFQEHAQFDIFKKVSDGVYFFQLL
ncbi:hypothetical protein I6M53_07780 [Shewanella algae]|uniref:hypothetical protein n=1 Tax=Shewanella algae TaxID=38313 RepID=UPI001AAD2CDF|nr:hypothetical protein [Shewanella algae]MBO2674566.1 hypothetical protein [Shewanella algae]